MKEGALMGGFRIEVAPSQLHYLTPASRDAWTHQESYGNNRVIQYTIELTEV